MRICSPTRLLKRDNFLKNMISEPTLEKSYWYGVNVKDSGLMKRCVKYK